MVPEQNSVDRCSCLVLGDCLFRIETSIDIEEEKKKTERADGVVDRFGERESSIGYEEIDRISHGPSAVGDCR